MVSSINDGCSFITAKVLRFINDEPFSFNSATYKAKIMLLLEDIFISQAPSSNSKVNKARDKSTNPGSRAAGRSKSCLKEGSDQASSTNESVNTTA